MSKHEKIMIRPATVDDLPILYQFEQGVIKAERPYDSTLGADPIHYYDLEEMITAASIQLVVAVLQNEVVASGYARIENGKPYLHYKQHAYLGFMYVTPLHRGKGINKQVIDYLEAWAKAQGITEMRLEVYEENTSAIAAYKKIGFLNLLVQMRKGLD